MAPQIEWSADDWIAAAERSYANDHQGCPACRQSHCVFRSQWAARVEYHCTACDFSASRDLSNGEARYSPGGEPAAACGLDLLGWAKVIGPNPFLPPEPGPG